MSDRIPRRSFLENLFSATVFATAAPTVLGKAFPAVSVQQNSLAGLYELDINEFFPLQEIGGSVRFIVSEVGPTFRIIVTRVAEDQFESVSAKCPHEGNKVRAANQDGLLICEAHDSTFEPDGTYVEGPAVDAFGNGLDLKRYPTSFDSLSTVTIDIDELSSVGSSESDQEFALLHSSGPRPNAVVFKYRLRSSGHARLSIWSLDGRQVLRPFDAQLHSGEGHIPVDLSQLSAGLYLFRFHVDGRPVGTGRVVVSG